MMMTSARRVLDRTYTQLHGTLVHSTVSVGVCAFSAVATVHRTQVTAYSTHHDGTLCFRLFVCCLFGPPFGLLSFFSPSLD
jgi:hypothetical protein